MVQCAAAEHSVSCILPVFVSLPACLLLQSPVPPPHLQARRQISSRLADEKMPFPPPLHDRLAPSPPLPVAPTPPLSHPPHRPHPQHPRAPTALARLASPPRPRRPRIPDGAHPPATGVLTLPRFSPRVVLPISISGSHIGTDAFVWGYDGEGEGDGDGDCREEQDIPVLI